jgi:hypothetical protein
VGGRGAGARGGGSRRSRAGRPQSSPRQCRSAAAGSPLSLRRRDEWPRGPFPASPAGGARRSSLRARGWRRRRARGAASPHGAAGPRGTPSSTPAFRHRKRRRWRRALPGLLRLLPADGKHEEASEREIRSCLRRPHPPLRLWRRLGRRARRPWVRGPHATSLFP